MKTDSNLSEKTKTPSDIYAIVIGDGAMPQDMSACWLEDDSLEGCSPLFEIKCAYHPEEPMALVYSHLALKESRVTKIAGRKIIMEYKCKKCGLSDRFYIDTSEEYIEKIRNKRELEGGLKNG